MQQKDVWYPVTNDWDLLSGCTFSTVWSWFTPSTNICTCNKSVRSGRVNVIISFFLGSLLSDINHWFQIFLPNSSRMLYIFQPLYHTITSINNSEKNWAFKNTVEKGENAVNQHFLLSQQCFLLLSNETSWFASHLNLSNKGFQLVKKCHCKQLICFLQLSTYL